MTDAKIAGGSEADRRKLLELHEEYLVAKGKIYGPGIKHMWSEEPHAAFFNLNGHTYRGAEHWRRLWEFYIKNVKGSYWTPFDIGGEIRGCMAVLWCHRHSQRNWVGTAAAPPRNIHYQGQASVSRPPMGFPTPTGHCPPLPPPFPL